MINKLGKKFWVSLIIFGLVGQVAWVVENMYLNVFMYKMFHASASDISLMVAASSVSAALTTILVGALSDKIGKRKIFICLGYIIWGITILGFSFIRMDILTPLAGGMTEAFGLGITLVILLDCIMTFFGSASNDACYNAWLTDRGDKTNRGKIEGYNSIMPLLAILVVFGGFMGFNLEEAGSWTLIFAIIGGIVLIIGIAGFFLIEEKEIVVQSEEKSYWKNVIYSFRISVFKKNKLLYVVLGCFALFNISIQTFMPYLILYYEQSLGMTNYVLIMAPAIIIAAIITALTGKMYDMQGFKLTIIVSTAILMSGYVILYFSRSTAPVFIGSLLMMTGYMTGMSIYGAMVRDNIPEKKAGQFQGVRIIGQVLIPGIIGPMIGAGVLRNAEQILNNDGTYSFLPNENIWAAAFVTGLVLCAGLWGIFWMMRKGHYLLSTESGEEVMKSDAPAWQEYPRPQMKRERYQILNGEWKLNRSPIQVPFAPQAVASNYEARVTENLEYEKTFSIPGEFVQERILLHFGAVDQVAEVWVNGQKIGRHEGGYLPFSFDITDAVNRDGENTLTVKATDTLSRYYPYGKQCKKRGGMWYTPVSGIWQTVWIENMPNQFIEKIIMTPDLEGVNIELQSEAQGFSVTVELEEGKTLTCDFATNKGRVQIEGAVLEDGTMLHAKLWNTQTPHLYPITIKTQEDTVTSYFALRTIAIKEGNGVKKVCLNNEPIFLHGVLDQGYYPEGIYLPPSEKEFDADILRMKELGYNLLRKHIKVEPEYFYYMCDKLGMLVMQDMVNNGSYSFIRDTALPTFGFDKMNDSRKKLTAGREFFIQHTKDTITQLYNHPCIIAYTIFNEGWGQFHSDAMYDMVKELDATRLIDSTSGWFWQNKNDFDSKHIYFKAVEQTVGDRPLFISECGGYSMAVKKHYYSKYSQYGYGSCSSKEELTEQILAMYRKMILPYVSQGLCGCVYTQLSDVEDEINGLYTYDRRVCKVDVVKMQELAGQLQAAAKE